MRVGIVGATSSLGLNLKHALEASGHEVFSWNRNTNSVSDHQLFFSIQEHIEEIQMPALDWVFIFAWKQAPRTRKTATLNEYSISKFIQIAKQNNIPVVFISTLGAVQASESWHVKAKQTIESKLSHTDIIIRPGAIRKDENKQFIGNVSWVDSLKVPFNLETKPPLLISSVEQSRVINTCLEIASEKTFDNFSVTNPMILNLVSEVTSLSLGPKTGRNIKILISQKNLSRIFRLLRMTKIPFWGDLADKWFALYSVQEFNASYLEQQALK